MYINNYKYRYIYVLNCMCACVCILCLVVCRKCLSASACTCFFPCCLPVRLSCPNPSQLWPENASSNAPPSCRRELSLVGSAEEQAFNIIHWEVCRYWYLSYKIFWVTMLADASWPSSIHCYFFLFCLICLLAFLSLTTSDSCKGLVWHQIPNPRLLSSAFKP